MFKVGDIVTTNLKGWDKVRLKVIGKDNYGYKLEVIVPSGQEGWLNEVGYKTHGWLNSFWIIVNPKRRDHFPKWW